MSKSSNNHPTSTLSYTILAIMLYIATTNYTRLALSFLQIKHWLKSTSVKKKFN